IACYQLALQERRQDNVPLDWAATQHNLAITYRDRIAGDRRENLEKAITCSQLALQEWRQDNVPLDWAMTQNNLAITYRDRIAGDRRENLEKAIACYQLALQERRQDNVPLDWAATQHNLAITYRDRIAGDRRENLEQAIASYQLALQERRQDNVPLDWAATQNNLGLAYTNRIAGDRRENLEKAIASYQLALQERRQDNLPLDCLQTRRNLGNLYFKEENWQQAIESYQIALEIIEDTRLQSLDEKRRQEIIAENIMVFVNIVRCFIQLKQYDKAIEYAGRSKTRNLVELITKRDLYPKGDIPQEVLAKLDSLRREILIETRKQFKQNEIKPFNRDSNLEQGMQPTPNLSPVIPDYSYVNQLQKELDQLIERDINPIDPEFQLTQKVTPISFEEIKALIDDDTAIIEWYFTDREILTFITTKQDRQPLVKPVSSFDEFTKQMSEYLDLYLINKQKWRTQLPSLLSKFTQILNLEEIITVLKEKYSQIILIPHLYLHLLPLHAFPLTDGKCLLDRFEQIKYAPSCQLLQLTQKRQRQESTNLFGVQNPTEDLFYTDIEVENISQIFHPHNDIIAKQAATKTALDTKNLQDKHYNHFSCHGYFNFREPLKSALILAGAIVKQESDGTLPNGQSVTPSPEKTIRSPEGENINLDKCLTLGDIFELDLRQCRLVTLSACETAITDIESASDEYISLPSGFLFAGACNVVATQWTVNDLSTAILMIKFYQLHKIDGLPVAKAMNEAQKWLRDGTQKVFWSWTEQLKNYLKLKQELIIQIQHYLRRFAPEEKPFTELFYWAAFCAIGK
nr:CHAT domain-containing protein [Xenococcaceae cyanobacterium MO_188.B29]